MKSMQNDLVGAMTVNLKNEHLFQNGQIGSKSRSRPNDRRNSSSKLSKEILNRNLNCAKLNNKKNGLLEIEAESKSVLNLHNVLAGEKTVKRFLTMENFEKLPSSCRKTLIKLLPPCDRINSSKLKLSSNALNNEYFTQACLDYKDRLISGHILPNGKPAEKFNLFSYEKLDPWKKRHFEAYFGEKLKESDSDSLSSNKTHAIKKVRTKKRRSQPRGRKSTSSDTNVRKKRRIGATDASSSDTPVENGIPLDRRTIDPAKERQAQQFEKLFPSCSTENSMTSQASISLAPCLPRLRINLTTKTVSLVPKDGCYVDVLSAITVESESSSMDSHETEGHIVIDEVESELECNGVQSATVSESKHVSLDRLTPVETVLTNLPEDSNSGILAPIYTDVEITEPLHLDMEMPQLSPHVMDNSEQKLKMEHNLRLFESRCVSNISSCSSNYRFTIRRPRSVPMMMSKMIFGTRYRANSSAYLIEDHNGPNNNLRKGRCSTPLF